MKADLLLHVDNLASPYLEEEYLAVTGLLRDRLGGETGNYRTEQEGSGE